jgi:hypothetical protein
MAALLTDSVRTSARTFPLFDDGAGGLMRAMVDEGKVIGPQTGRSTEIGVAGRLLGGLEAFPFAAMDELVDVRERLARPLTRLRAVLARASVQFESAAWDEQFAREADDFYRREVSPALADVAEALEELGARPTLLRVVARKETVAAAAASLGLAAANAQFGALPDLIFGAPAASIVAAGAAEALERRKSRRAAAANSFYFLYAANRELGGQ